MQRRIIVGFDGSEQSHDAVALARDLAEIDGAELIVAWVYYLYRRTSAEKASHELEATARKILADADVSESTAQEAVGAESPAEGLHRVATEHEGDLLVVGSSHRGRLGRVFPGSVGRRLLHGAPCAVAVAPVGYRDRSERAVRRVGIAYDGSAESRRALAAGRALAEAAHASAVVLTVAEPDAWGEPGRLIGKGMPNLHASVREDREREAKEAVAELPRDLDPQWQVLDGRPGKALIAATETVDLLVAGSRGYGRPGQVLLGSLTAELVEASACPVLVVPRGAEQAPGEVQGELAAERA
jgi:nucleotide-binding universal stress UspA family protein